LKLQLNPFTLTEWIAPHTLAVMEVHFTPDQIAQLAQIAAQQGVDTEKLVKDAVLTLLQDDEHFRAAVRRGLEQADRDEFIEEDEMDARIKRMFQS
jgi:predicted transcriptional regulator